MELSDALTFAATTNNGVLTTIKRNGRPQLSNITYWLSDTGTIRISITADRAKYHNIVRDPRVSLYVTRADFWAYAVLEGDAVLSAVAAATDDAATEELVDLYRQVRGEHPDWDEYRAAMVSEHRCVLHITPTHAYGMIRG